MSQVSPARAAALRTVQRVFREDAYADRAFRAEAAGLDPRERAFAQVLAYGTVQRVRTLDHVIGRLADRAPDPDVMDPLRLGVFQLLHAGSVPDRAAVDQTVEAVPVRAHGFANAVMRRAAREAEGIVAGLPEASAAEAALRHSYPDWIAELWWEALGPAEARALMLACNEPAESAVRVNTLAASPAHAAEVLGVPTRPAAGIPEGLVLEAPLDIHASRAFTEGLVMPQSRASMGVARALDPQPGERVLDLCAAPGAKATHLAALMEGEGEVVAVERNPARAQELAANAARLGARSVRVVVADALEFEDAEPFDAVLLDPPCTALGTLQARPDVRWRHSREDVGELAALQARMLARALSLGGRVVYSTCTISPAENEGVAEGGLLTLPSRDGTDGFYVAPIGNN